MNAPAVSAKALALLKRSGTTYSLVRGTATPTTASPWKVTSTATVTQTVYGCLVDFRASERDGEVVRANDRRYLVAANGQTSAPAAGDAFTDGTDIFRVVSVEAVRAKATDVVYYLQVRR